MPLESVFGLDRS